GLALFAFGAFGVSLWKTETVVFLKPGEAAPVAGYAVTLDRVAPTTRENFQAETAYLTARKGGRAIALQAERRFYPVRRMQTTEAAIRPRAHGDLYVTFGERVEGRGWPVRLTFHPFAGALWWGAGLAAFGGLLALTDRGKRPRAAASQETTGPTAVGVPSPAE
ncbi:MAG: cytochrome c-type biogenesis CcmF C-terminal domain-containing protein, partial [Pseudomonadota bacterium]